jgi:hypothetical protein
MLPELVNQCKTESEPFFRTILPQYSDGKKMAMSDQWVV